MPFKDQDKARAARRAAYYKRRSYYKQKRQDRKREMTQWMASIKATLECERCHESHPACLEFHHPEPNAKDFAVADAIRDGYSKQRILDEIAKCEVLCANCHRKHHYEGR